jgi:sulfite exporter TauE/SafE
MIIKLFSFLKSYVGRGFFLIFIGVLCFDNLEKLKKLRGWSGLVIGILIIIFGVYLLIMGLKGEKPVDESK